MRFVFAAVCLASLLTGSVGCSLFQKKGGAGDRPSSNGGGGPAPSLFPGTKPNPTPAPADPILNTGATSLGGAVLAGRVIDRYSRPAGNSFVRWVSLDDKDGKPGQDIAVTPEGYFTIQGLKPGVGYKLIARTKTGDQVLAGMTYTTAPNIRVVIQVKEDLVTPSTPGVPGDNTPQAGRGATGDFVGASPPKLFVEPDLPAVTVPTPPVNNSPANNPPPNNQSWTPGVANGNNNFPPTMDIPPPRNTKPAPPLQIPRNDFVPKNNAAGDDPLLGFNAAPPPGVAAPPGAPPQAASVQPLPPVQGGVTNQGAGALARVPSCVLVGNQLVNFALNDVDSKTWEFRRDHKGKLVLIDFWGTACVPCRETLPDLVTLHKKYAPAGLEILGLAYEHSGTASEQAYRVNLVAQRSGLPYRQLLGAGTNCPVRTQFGVRLIPTLVLLDDNGWILWRHEGKPDRAALDELERLIQRRLPPR